MPPRSAAVATDEPVAPRRSGRGSRISKSVNTTDNNKKRKVVADNETPKKKKKKKHEEEDEGPAALPSFEYVNTYENTRNWIWPELPLPPLSAFAEPPRLTGIIRSIIPDDRWLLPATVGGGGGGEGEGGGESGDVGDGPAEIRYIELSRHPQLQEFLRLRQETVYHGDKAIFIIREEYQLLLKYIFSLLCAEPPERASFFVTGQPGIGRSFGALYFLLCFLGMGKSVFFIQNDTTYFFGADGVQKLKKAAVVPESTEFMAIVENSWVIIDVEDKIPSPTFALAALVIWTSSPRDVRWRYFRSHFLPAQRWFVKPWNTKEIAATVSRLGSVKADVLARMAWCGPIPRHLFLGAPRTMLEVTSDIERALSGNLLHFEVDEVFLVSPAVVEDASGSHLVRTDFSAQFLTPTMATKTIHFAEYKLHQLQGFLSSALDVPATRGVAGRLVEGIMHRAISKGTHLPTVFGSHVVLATLELIGKSDVFVSKSDTPSERPLYLRPLVLSFPAVDAMVLVNPSQLGLLQTSLAETHGMDFGTMLKIISRLPKGARVEVKALEDIVYCLIGTDPTRVRDLAREAKTTLAKLKNLAKDNPQKFSRDVAITTEVARARIQMFRVVGVTFNHQAGFTDVNID